MKSNIHDDCQKTFKEIKFDKNHRFVTYKVDNESVVVETIGAREDNWAKFLATLPAKEPRMCVFDLEYTSNDGMNCSRLFFCYWLPDGTPIKLKLLYATVKENFRTFLDMGGKQIVLNSYDDFNEEQLIKEFDK